MAYTFYMHILCRAADITYENEPKRINRIIRIVENIDDPNSQTTTIAPSNQVKDQRVS